MPIEIKELHIKINVTPAKESSSATPPASTGELVSEVLESVMETLQRKKER